MRRHEDLSTPRKPGIRLGIYYDPEAFGRFSETIARFLGTARFLVAQTVVVVIWITINVVAVSLRWDPYPFILLNLLFSTQAAYAAPLILLAQNRQAERDRIAADRDRQNADAIRAETQYLSLELASIRVSLSDVITTEDLETTVDRIAELLQQQNRPSTDS